MSTKSLPEKLLIKPETSVWPSDPEYLELIEPLPPGVRVVDAPQDATTALLFAHDAQSLHELVAAHADRLADPETLWVAYPKGNRTDINRDSVWPLLAEHGMRPIGQVSLSDVWSVMRFRPLKPGEAPFTGGAGS
jgi:hypothetical protein